MKLYVIYDRDTGEVVHTHTSYVLGNDEPVTATEEDVLAVAPRGLEGRSIAVAQAPEDFDPRSRLQRLRVDTATGEVRLVEAERPSPERSTRGGQES